MKKAVDEDNIDELKCLINEVGNKNPIIYNHGINPLPLLHYAAWNGKDKSFQEVSGGLTIKNPPMLSKSDFNRWTPMHFAASNGHTTIISIIAKMDDVNVNTKNANGSTPLHLAARISYHLSSVKCLIKLNADPKIKNNFGETAYDCAYDCVVRYNKSECAEYLQQYN